MATKITLTQHDHTEHYELRDRDNSTSVELDDDSEIKLREDIAEQQHVL